MRWWLVALAVASLWSGDFELRGRVSATDQEADEGYFAIDQETMIVAKPGSELHAYLRGQAGKRLRITFAPEE